MAFVSYLKIWRCGLRKKIVFNGYRDTDYKRFVTVISPVWDPVAFTGGYCPVYPNSV